METIKSYLWGVFGSLGGGAVGSVLGFVVQSWVSSGTIAPRLFANNYYGTVWFWLASWAGTFVVSVVFLVYRVQRVNYIRKEARKMVGGLHHFILRQALNADIEVDIYYRISHNKRGDDETIYYDIIPRETVKAKYIIIGGQDGKPFLFDQMLTLAPQAQEITELAPGEEPTIVSIVPYRIAGVPHLALGFSPPLEVGRERKFMVHLRRPGLWDKLRKMGEDEGSYNYGSLKPKRLTIHFLTSERRLHAKDMRIVLEEGNEAGTLSTGQYGEHTTQKWEVNVGSERGRFAYNIYKPGYPKT